MKEIVSFFLAVASTLYIVAVAVLMSQMMVTDAFVLSQSSEGYGSDQ